MVYFQQKTRNLDVLLYCKAGMKYENYECDRLAIEINALARREDQLTIAQEGRRKSSLIQALSAKLAANIAYSITGSNSVVQTMYAKYEAEVKEARFNDATESATQRLEASDLIESRF